MPANVKIIFDTNSQYRCVCQKINSFFLIKLICQILNVISYHTIYINILRNTNLLSNCTNHVESIFFEICFVFYKQQTMLSSIKHV